MITVRLHLDEDDGDEGNGALRVISGRHRLGRVSGDAIQHLRGTAKVCTVPAGGALLLRPLLLHSSGRSLTGAHRRVIHIEYAGFDLPGGLQWHEAPDG